MAFDLASIKRGKNVQAPRIVLYGIHGIGKSTFGAAAPNPIFIRTEDGLGTIDTTYFGDVAKSSGDVLSAITTLYNEEHEFKTVVIDSADWLERLIVSEVEGTYDEKSLAYGKSALLVANDWTGILDGLTALRNDRNMTIILIAHTEIKRFDSPETEPYDRYQPKLQSRSSALLQEWADAVLFANYKTVIKKDDVGFNKTNARGVSTGQRLIYTSETPAFYAKNRYNLPQSLPFEWQAFSDAITQSIA